MIILLEIHEQNTSPEKLERAQYLMALNLAQYQFPTWVLKGWKHKQFWQHYQIGPDTLQLSTDVFLKGGLYLSLPPRKNRLLKSHATPCENCDLMSHFFCSQPMNFQVKKVGQYLCLWVGDGKKPGSRGRYRYGEVRILVLLRTFRLETYLVFSIFQLWEMWVAIAQRWSPGQDSPSEARPRPYALSLLSEAALMWKYLLTKVPRHDSEEYNNLWTLNTQLPLITVLAFVNLIFWL